VQDCQRLSNAVIEGALNNLILSKFMHLFVKPDIYASYFTQ